MYAAFPRSEYYQRIRLPPQRLPFSGMIHIVRHTQSASGAVETTVDLSGSSMLHSLNVPSLQPRRSLRPPLPFAVNLLLPSSHYYAVDLRVHILTRLNGFTFRYGPLVALSTLSPFRCLHRPKTRFPVRRLHLLSGRAFHPLEASGLS